MTATVPRRLHLLANAWLHGFSPSAWRMPDAAPRGFIDVEHYVRIARIAEEGRFDALLLPDSLAADGLDTGPMPALDPLLVLTAVACATTRIGLIGSVSAGHGEPRDIARRLGSLDLLSGGRAGWNLALTPGHGPDDDAAAHPRRADECASVVKGLWNGWPDDALVADARSGRFVDTGKLRPLRHHGEFFSVQGLLNQPRSPQGHPVLLQTCAPGDGDANALAARHAEAVLTTAPTLDAALDHRHDLRLRALALGRDDTTIRVFAGLATCIGGTEAEARRRHRELIESIPQPRVRKPAARRMTAALAMAANGELLDDDTAAAERMVDHGPNPAAARGFASPGNGYRELIGTPEQIADEMERWFRAGAADGFSLLPDVLPGGLQDFVDGVVPILQKRGLFRTDYEGVTLRDHLGLPRPAGRG